MLIISVLTDISQPVHNRASLLPELLWQVKTGQSKPKPDNVPGHGFICPDCGNFYNHYSSLKRHLDFECNKEPQFMCPHCPQKIKQKAYLLKHIRKFHPEQPSSTV